MLLENPSPKLERYFIYLTGAFLLAIFALYNGYPIVTGDTTTYLDSGFHLTVPDERPVFYGLFLRITSLGISLWLSVFAQCFILSYLLVNFIKGLLPRVSALPVIGLLMIISLGTILSWYASQLMADVFTPVLFLASVNYLLFAKNKRQSVLLLAIVYLATVVHFSHCIISTLFTLLLLVLSFFKGHFKEYRKKAMLLLSVSLLSWFSIFTSNYMGGKGFVSSSVSHVFLMGKLSESGVLKTYLDKACPIKDYKICTYKDSLPPAAWEFVWNQQSPVFRTGGWMANKQEYKAIIGDITSRPKYWPYMAWKSIEATARQVILTNMDEGEERPWIKYEYDHPVYKSIKENFPHEINEFAICRQNMKTLNMVFYDDVYVIVLILSTLMCLFCLKGNLLREAKMIYMLTLSFLLINAFASATFANVISRLNSRAVWLLPMVNIIFIYKIVTQYFARLNGHQNTIKNRS